MADTTAPTSCNSPSGNTERSRNAPASVARRPWPCPITCAGRAHAGLRRRAAGRARAESQLAADEVVLGVLRVFEGARLVRPDGAGVRERRAEQDLIEVV